MLPITLIIVSVISMFIILGTTTAFYVQNKNNDDKFNEIADKTNYANKYEYDKNIVQDVTFKEMQSKFDKNIVDLTATDTQIAKTLHNTDIRLTQSIEDTDTRLTKTLQETNTRLTKTLQETDTRLTNSIGDTNAQLTKSIGDTNTRLTNSIGDTNTRFNSYMTSDDISKNYITKNDNKSINDQLTVINGKLVSTTDTVNNMNKDLTTLKNTITPTLITDITKSITTLSTTLSAYAKTSDLVGYAKASDLAGYAKASDLGTYAKASDLSGYAKTADVTNTYAKASDTKTSVDTITAKLTSLQTLVDSITQTYVKTADLKVTTSSGTTSSVDINTLNAALKAIQSNLDVMNNSLTAFKTDVPNTYVTKTSLDTINKSLTDQINALKTTITTDTMTVNKSFTTKGGTSEHNPNNAQTHFPWSGDNKNYIRGDTEIRGNTYNVGDISVGRNVGITGSAWVGGDIITSGKNNWIIHTPDDGRRTMYIAPSKTEGQWDWDWANNIMLNNVDGSVNANRMNSKDVNVGGKLCVGSTCVDQGTFNKGSTSGGNYTAGTQLNFPNNGTGLSWGADYSKIYDNGHLHIDTDDNMYMKAPNILSVQQANNNTVNFTPGWQGTPDGATNISEISNDTGGFKTLMIVGNKSAGAERRVGIWDRLDVNGTLNTTGTTITNKLTTPQGVSVTNGDPGPLIEKNYGKDSDRYGIGQFPNGTTRVYTATAYGGSVNLSLAKDNNTFDDVVSVKPNRDVNITGSIKTPNAHTIESAGRQHISAGELLYLLPKDGVMITKDWGANGNLRVDGDVNIGGAVNISNKWRLGDTGDGWLRLNKAGTPAADGNYWGGFAANELWTRNFYNASDQKLKQNISSLSKSDTDSLSQLNPKSYQFIDDKEKTKRYGFIAQDVEKVYPNLVSSGVNGEKGLNYMDIIPLTVAGIQKINKQVKEDRLCIDDVCLTKADLLKLKSL